MSQQWNAGLYQQSCGFVWQLGRDVLGLLDPKPGERILDIGCGTGQLTAEVVRSGAQVTGIDRSASMIERARSNFPEIEFRVEDVREMRHEGEFDAVFSNAVLHWVVPAEAAVAAMARALKPGGRLAVELGGRGNIVEIIRAAEAAWQEIGAGEAPLSPWYYPGVAEYASLLERHGLEVTFAVLFDRPTPLEGGAAGLGQWFEMFGGHWTAGLTIEQRAVFMRAAERLASATLLRNGTWTADYRRLRVVARK